MSIYYALAGWSGNRERRDERTKEGERESIYKSQNDHADHRKAGAHRHPWALATLEESLVCCQPFKISAAQRTKICRCEVSHESVNGVKSARGGEEGRIGVCSICILYHLQAFRAAKFRALYCMLSNNNVQERFEFNIGSVLESRVGPGAESSEIRLFHEISQC
ncbi:hypothetical protein EVAR_63440_1 [Eumeta japonica]|uniref:Uncharacterized protein n=1 Tax=Eumeta variegata TaxID=151549 RepID=A0A4C1YWN3_EUMVA|nr:hypothetical protein EVAR_63440_1 [Eumeta japonica]